MSKIGKLTLVAILAVLVASPSYAAWAKSKKCYETCGETYYRCFDLPGGGEACFPAQRCTRVCVYE